MPIVLQDARGKEQSLANLPSCEIDFTFRKRKVSLSHASHSIRQTFNARDELLHLWCFFIDVLQSNPFISKSLPIRIASNSNLLLFSQIARNKKNYGGIRNGGCSTAFPLLLPGVMERAKKGRARRKSGSAPLSKSLGGSLLRPRGGPDPSSPSWCGGSARCTYSARSRSGRARPPRDRSSRVRPS